MKTQLVPKKVHHLLGSREGTVQVANQEGVVHVDSNEHPGPREKICHPTDSRMQPQREQGRREGGRVEGGTEREKELEGC